jgi:hypothetical protein
VLNEASESSVNTEVAKTTVPSVDQQLTIITQYKIIASSKSLDLESSVRILIALPTPVTHISTTAYPTVTEQGTTVDTDPSLATTARKSSQAVTLREAVAWALLSLMTLMFIGTLSMATILCIQKHKQKRDNTAEAPAYEMDGNPCYESSKMDNTHGTNVYEPIESDRV